MFNPELIKPPAEYKRIGWTSLENNQIGLTYLTEFTDEDKQLVEEVAAIAQYSRTGGIISILEHEMDKYEPFSEGFDALGDAVALIIELTNPPKEEPNEPVA